MFVNFLCEILLLVCVTLADKELSLDGIKDVERNLEFLTLANNTLHHQFAPCASNADCHHLGKCETKDGDDVKTCICKAGTSGDFCERVDECVDNPVRCGTRDDVSCVFDFEQETAVCKCDDDFKTYVVDEERCMSPCTHHDQCGQYGSCYHEVGDQKFCACDLGTSGDYCDIIDECHNKHVDCGVDSNATCTLGDDGSAYCKCAYPLEAFNYDQKVCKVCFCRGNSNVNGCYFDEFGRMECDCLKGYSQLEDECKECDCGHHGVCSFVGWGYKTCYCDEGYIEVDETCKAQCTSDRNCHHLGKCETVEGYDVKTCICKAGTSGDFCEKVDECVDNPVRCGTQDDVSCVFDFMREKADCKCDDDSKTYVVDEERCMSPCTQHDQCGQYGSCYHEIGDQKFCACDLGTSGDYCDIIDECHNKHVDCGDKASVACTLGDQGTAYCKCANPQQIFDYVAKVCKARCTSDADCHHLGKCQTRENGLKSCICKAGTSGDWCETVDECVDNPTKCGTGDDVSCIFDVSREKADCKCDNDSKTYIVDEERCMSPCTSSNQCRLGYCSDNKVGNRTFCTCSPGTSGDFCEIIDDCVNKHVDCGAHSSATCTLEVWGESAFCKCADRLKGFDYDEKVCKDCAGCGKNLLNGCEYRDGIRKCNCQSDYYSSDKGICEACNCGLYSNHCEFKNGTKICHCHEGAAIKDGVCKRCKCGSYGSKCEFRDGKPFCICKEGDVKTGPDGICTKMCNATYPCQHGGKCLQNVCHCLKFTSGDLCQIIDVCRGARRCGGATECLYNVTSQAAYCKCHDDGLEYDELARKCKTCNCGIYSKSCTYEKGSKTCDCRDGYGDRKGECTQCDCGDRGKCQFYDWRKSCTCDAGYLESGGKCKECNCGDHGKCGIYDGRKSCACDEGYLESGGKCKECNCGENGKCVFKNDQKMCSCKEGYAEYLGTCKACDCDPGTSCIFESDLYTFKVCVCPKGYADDLGSCKECDCGMEDANCTLIHGVKQCKCPTGYEEVKNRFDTFNSSCKDINECLQSNACPDITTECINTPGSYNCVCKEGYEENSERSTYDIKTDGCQDIDECVLYPRHCNYQHATCVNTPGSYNCECQQGFSLQKAQEENNNVCVPDSQLWKTVAIVMGCLAIVIISGVLFGIHKRRRDKRTVPSHSLEDLTPSIADSGGH